MAGAPPSFLDHPILRLLEPTMFGLSLSKLLALIGILMTVWMVFRWASRMANARDREARVGREQQAKRPAAWGRRKEPEAAPVEDLVACGTCGAYIPAKGARGCGRGNCPWPG